LYSTVQYSTVSTVCTMRENTIHNSQYTVAMSCSEYTSSQDCLPHSTVRTRTVRGFTAQYSMYFIAQTTCSSSCSRVCVIYRRLSIFHFSLSRTETMMMADDVFLGPRRSLIISSTTTGNEDILVCTTVSKSKERSVKQGQLFVSDVAARRNEQVHGWL